MKTLTDGQIPESIMTVYESIQRGKCATCQKESELYGDGECRDCLMRSASKYLIPPICRKNTCECLPNIRPAEKSK